MPEITITPPSSGAIDPVAVSLGYKTWNYNLYLVNNQSTPTSQTIFAFEVPTVAGQQYTGVRLGIGTAGSGTPPTGFFVGLATTATTGVMLAQSANLAASTSLTTANVQNFAFNAAYTETGLSTPQSRMVVLLMNGTFGTTPAQIGRFNQNAIITTVGTVVLYATAGTGQTALPANGAALPGAYAAASSGFVYHVGLY